MILIWFAIYVSVQRLVLSVDRSPLQARIAGGAGGNELDGD